MCEAGTLVEANCIFLWCSQFIFFSEMNTWCNPRLKCPLSQANLGLVITQPHLLISKPGHTAFLQVFVKTKTMKMNKW